MSKDFYAITQDIYYEHHQMAVYSEFLWTIWARCIRPFFTFLNHPPDQADIYHAVSTGYAGIAAALGKRKWGGKMLLTEHGIYTRETGKRKSSKQIGCLRILSSRIHYFKNLRKRLI